VSFAAITLCVASQRVLIIIIIIIIIYLFIYFVKVPLGDFGYTLLFVIIGFSTVVYGMDNTEY